ncbi:hypothetical protein COP2_025241 [Malus domestica]
MHSASPSPPLSLQDRSQAEAGPREVRGKDVLVNAWGSPISNAMDESGSYQNEYYTQDSQRVRLSSTMNMHVMTLDANSVYSPNSACSNGAD